MRQQDEQATNGQYRHGRLGNDRSPRLRIAGGVDATAYDHPAVVGRDDGRVMGSVEHCQD